MKKEIGIKNKILIKDIYFLLLPIAVAVLVCAILSTGGIDSTKQAVGMFGSYGQYPAMPGIPTMPGISGLPGMSQPPPKEPNKTAITSYTFCNHFTFGIGGYCRQQLSPDSEMEYFKPECLDDDTIVEYYCGLGVEHDTNTEKCIRHEINCDKNEACVINEFQGNTNPICVEKCLDQGYHNGITQACVQLDGSGKNEYEWKYMRCNENKNGIIYPTCDKNAGACIEKSISCPAPSKCFEEGQIWDTKQGKYISPIYAKCSFCDYNEEFFSGMGSYQSSCDEILFGVIAQNRGISVEDARHQYEKTNSNSYEAPGDMNGDGNPDVKSCGGCFKQIFSGMMMP
jgi:hypothetical protein